MEPQQSTMTHNIDRRKLLKSAVASGPAILFGPSSVSAEPEEFGSVRLIEAGVRYRLEEDHEYFAISSEGESGYWVDSWENQINIKPTLPEAALERFKSNKLLVGSRTVSNPPVQVTQTDLIPGLPTKLRNGRMPVESVVLAEPHQPPAVSVNTNSATPIIRIEDQMIHSEPGLGVEIELDSTRVVVQTEIVTDEIVEIEGVPKDEWGPKIEFGKVETEATPIVSITDHGVLPIVKLDSRN